MGGGRVRRTTRPRTYVPATTSARIGDLRFFFSLGRWRRGRPRSVRRRTTNRRAPSVCAELAEQNIFEDRATRALFFSHRPIDRSTEKWKPHSQSENPPDPLPNGDRRHLGDRGFDDVFELFRGGDIGGGGLAAIRICVQRRALLRPRVAAGPGAAIASAAPHLLVPGVFGHRHRARERQRDQGFRCQHAARCSAGGAGDRSSAVRADWDRCRGASRTALGKDGTLAFAADDDDTRDYSTARRPRRLRRATRRRDFQRKRRDRRYL